MLIKNKMNHVVGSSSSSWDFDLTIVFFFLAGPPSFENAIISREVGLRRTWYAVVVAVVVVVVVGRRCLDVIEASASLDS